jgi:peptidoglycan/LPS O-acetylase OafA/YrhL
MLWVGSRSYALYLIHIPAFYIRMNFGSVSRGDTSIQDIGCGFS